MLSTRWMVKYPSYGCWGPTIRHEVGKTVWIFRFSSLFFCSWKLLVPDPWGHHRRHQGYMPWACLKVELPKLLPSFIISNDITHDLPIFMGAFTPTKKNTELGWLDHVISHRFWEKSPSAPGSLGRAHLLALIVGLVSMKVPPVWDPRTGAAVVVNITLQLNPDIPRNWPINCGLSIYGKSTIYGSVPRETMVFQMFSWLFHIRWVTESAFKMSPHQPRLWAVPCCQVQRFEAGG